MKKILITGLFAGILVFAWEAFSWMVLPWHMQTINHVADDKEVTEALIKNTQTEKSKIYFLPNSEKCSTATPAEPHIFIAYVPQHHGFKENLLFSLISQIFTACIIAGLMTRIGEANYWCKVGCVTAIGLIMGLNSFGAMWNWWGFASDYTLVGLADSVVAWLIGGLILAKN